MKKVEAFLTGIEIGVSVAWLVWIVTGGNAGDMDITIKGTTIAFVVAGTAFVYKMIWRWRHD